LSFHFCNDETVFDRGKFVTDAIPDGLEALAVATPGCVELDENILCIIEYDIVEVLSNNSVHTLVLGLWNGLTL